MTIRVLLVCGSLQARSSNRAALDVARAHLLGRADLVVDEADGLASIPPFDADVELDPPPSVVRFRDQTARCDAALLAAPEYAGGLAGMVKNVLDWHVGGAGGLYVKPVGVLSCGTSGGRHARRQLAQTLTWQGAHVVADLGIGAPRTKSDADGRFTDDATIARIEAWADLVVDALDLDPATRLAHVEAVTAAVGVEPGHIAPIA